MKIREIITESEDNIANIAAILQRDCRPFLAEINSDIKRYPLLRGVNILATDIVAVKTNKNRQPVDMPKVVSNAIDDYFEETTGIRWRSSSIFVSGNESVAVYYGNVFCVFPIGKFHYCWSPRVSDLFNNLDRQLGNHNMAYRTFQKNLDVMGEEEEPEKRILAFNTLHDTIMPSFEYQVDTGLTDAIEMANAEIMISCDKYYLVSTTMANAVADIIRGNNL